LTETFVANIMIHGRFWGLQLLNRQKLEAFMVSGLVY